MAKTEIKGFEREYPNIDPPTVEDLEAREQGIRYKLIQEPFLKQDYMNEAIFMLRNHPWTAKRKFDGTNIRIKWDGNQALVAGKTNSFNAEALVGLPEFIEEVLIEERFEQTLGRGKTFYLFGEWMGPKVEGNELGLEKPEIVLYDVCTEAGVWLAPENVISIAEGLNLHHFESEGYGEHVDEADNLNELLERVQSGAYKDWEGVVAEPLGQLKDRQGNRILCKIKNKYYNPEWKKRKK